MATPNEQMVAISQRADTTLEGMTTQGGALAEDVANQFIDLVLDRSSLLSRMRVERMSAPQKRIPKMGLNRKFLRAARQAPGSRRLTEDERSAINFDYIYLDVKEWIGEIRIPYEVFEDTSGDNFEDVLMRQIAEETATNLAEYALLSDTASTDPDFNKLDGFIKTAGSIVDAAGQPLVGDVFDQVIRTLPSRYLRFAATKGFKHMIPLDPYISYKAHLRETRQTVAGDNIRDGMVQLYGSSYPANHENILDFAGDFDGTDESVLNNKMLSTFDQNMVMGIWRQITLERDRDIGSREMQFVLTLRTDFTYDEPDASVVTENLSRTAAPAVAA